MFNLLMRMSSQNRTRLIFFGCYILICSPVILAAVVIGFLF